LRIDTPATDFYRLSDSAWDLAKKGQYEPAIAEWKKALQLSPENDRAHNNVVFCSPELESFDEAIPHFEKTLKVNPEYPDAHSNLGVALAGTGNPDQAIVEFEKALKINPGSAEAHNNLGRTLAGKGKLDEAIPHFLKPSRSRRIPVPFTAISAARWRRRAGSTKRSHTSRRRWNSSRALAEMHNSLAVALVKKERVDEAIAHFLKAVEINPDFADAHFNLGDTLYYLKGNLPEALAHWRVVLRIDPSHVPVLNQTAWYWQPILRHPSETAFRQSNSPSGR